MYPPTENPPHKLLSSGAGDTLQIRGLAVSVSVGVTEEERAQKQNLLIDIEMEPQRSFDRLSEDISLTADYDQAAQKIRDFCTRASCRLIETLALEVVTLLLAGFPLKRASVRVRKFILSDTEFVAACITRERSD